MVVPDVVLDEEPLVVAGCRYGLVIHRQPGDDPTRVVGVAHADHPRPVAAIAEHPAVAAGGDQRVRDPPRG